jgi:hypothetical protein
LYWSTKSLLLLGRFSSLPREGSHEFAS